MKTADNSKEVIDIVDEDDKVISFAPKGKVHQESKRHREIGVIIFNQNHKVLLQRRNLEKKYFPGMWSITATGHVHTGIAPIEAAHAELKEELGFDVDLLFLEKEKMIYEENRSFGYIFIGNVANSVDLKIDKEELEEAKFFSRGEYEVLCKSNQVEPFSINTLDKIKDGYYSNLEWL